jgi:hypothetical protein
VTRRIALAALLALVLVLAPTALAGKAPGPTSTGATLTASPNPVPAWSQYSLSGCGYVAGKQVTIVINNGTFFSAGLDSAGCLLPVSWWTSGPGSYRIDAYQTLRSRKQSLMASTMLTAY